jgi:cysteine-S-conjugate beta-lyase
MDVHKFDPDHASPNGQEWNVATEMAHLFDDRQSHHGSVNPPVVHASTYAFPDYETWKANVTGECRREFTYNRHGNPTVKLLEQKVAHLEGAADCIASASGMSAISMVLAGLLQAGDHVLCVKTVYGPVRSILNTFFQKFGVETTYFPAADSADLTPYLKENTRLIYLESPSTGIFEIQDLRAVAQLARQRGIWTAIDNTWATPLFQRPLDMGIDISLHSGTKYISGHSDLMLGLVTGTAAAMQKIRGVYSQLGASLSPDDAYLALRGIRTLPLRLQRHQESAMKVARWLVSHPEVEEVLHPGLKSFPGHALHRRQSCGDSGLFAFRLRARVEAARAAFINILQLYSLGYSWGGYESLMSPLAFSNYGNDALRRDLGLTDHHFRVSIGLEEPADLIQDLDRALAIYATYEAE